MLQDPTTPVTWLQSWIETLRWPGIVVAAFWLGRLVQKLEQRLAKAEETLVKAENNIEALIARHLPAIHRALSEIRGLLERD